jgi:hypothetical protein
MNLQLAHRIEPKAEYVETSLDALNHLFGRNYYGRSYRTNEIAINWNGALIYALAGFVEEP